MLGLGWESEKDETSLKALHHNLLQNMAYRTKQEHTDKDHELSHSQRHAVSLLRQCPCAPDMG